MSYSTFNPSLPDPWLMSYPLYNLTEYISFSTLFVWHGCLQAEPAPQITWLKDDEPISPWINIITIEGMSQLVIPSSKRSDSGIFTIIAKNSVGESSFDIEIRVTGEDLCLSSAVVIMLHWDYWSHDFIINLQSFDERFYQTERAICMYPMIIDIESNISNTIIFIN